ncbi:DUF2946 domain-containing protein [Pseudomonas cerasi]
MVSFYRLSQRRMPAFIAILAILLLFIAPDVSKSLAHQPVSASDSAVSEVHAAMASMHHEDMNGMMMDTQHSPQLPIAATPQSAHTMPGEMGIMDDFACGYCQLLVHFPILLIIFIPLIWILFRLTLQMPASPYQSWCPSAFFPGISQPRAPPVFPSSF